MLGREEELTERDLILADIVEAVDELKEKDGASKEEAGEIEMELVDNGQAVRSTMRQVGQSSSGMNCNIILNQGNISWCSWGPDLTKAE